MKAPKCKVWFSPSCFTQRYEADLSLVLLCKQPAACLGSDMACLPKRRPSSIWSHAANSGASHPPLPAASAAPAAASGGWLSAPVGTRPPSRGLLHTSSCWAMLLSALPHGREMPDAARDVRDCCAWRWQSQNYLRYYRYCLKITPCQTLSTA